MDQPFPRSLLIQVWLHVLFFPRKSANLHLVPLCALSIAGTVGRRWIGEDALNIRGLARLHFPIFRGEVKSSPTPSKSQGITYWDDVTDLWSNAFQLANSDIVRLAFVVLHLILLFSHFLLLLFRREQACF
jgi:hypothetical protein